MSRLTVSEEQAFNVIAPTKSCVKATSTAEIDIDLSPLLSDSINSTTRYVRVGVIGDIHWLSCQPTTGTTLEIANTSGFETDGGRVLAEGGEVSFIIDPENPILTIRTNTTSGVVTVTPSS